MSFKKTRIYWGWLSLLQISNNITTTARSFVVCLFQLPDVNMKSSHSPCSPYSDVEEQMLKSAIAESAKGAIK